MLNQVILVGRLKEIATQGEWVKLTMACPRPFKNNEGEYETDTITCMFKDNGGNMSLVKKGDVIGIKGRVECLENIMKIVAEKVTFLSSRTNTVDNYE